MSAHRKPGRIARLRDAYRLAQLTDEFERITGDRERAAELAATLDTEARDGV